MTDSFAMFVGIDKYDSPGIRDFDEICENDAREMADLLARHEDGTPNFSTQLLPGTEASTDAMLTGARALFSREAANVLFYFSGHGIQMTEDGYLVSRNAGSGSPGLAMSTLLTLANLSRSRTRLIILDCCHAGQAGDPLLLGDGNTLLREGVTILAAAGADEAAIAIEGHSVFTRLLLGGLRGGAADLRGRVSAAALYAYVEKALGEQQQRPYYKSYARALDPVRLCKTNLSREVLYELLNIFPNPGDACPLTPASETTNPRCDPEAVAIFNKLKLYRNAGLLHLEDDLYWCAINGLPANLNGLGQYYWQLAKSKLL